MLPRLTSRYARRESIPSDAIRAFRMQMQKAEQPRLMTRDEFSYALDAFLIEAHGLLMVDPEKVLPANAELRTEIEETLAGLRDPRTTAVEAVGLALGIVDEFVRARWDYMVDESYGTYLDMNGGRSTPHPGSTDGSDGV